MFGPLKSLFDVLRRRHAEDPGFASRLHPGRTVFLSEMIADIKKPERIALLGAPWLDAGRFTARIAAACVFLDGVARAQGVRGWEGMPLVFLQSGSADEDARQHLDILAFDRSGHYAERFAHLPPAVRYLHTHAQFAHAMKGKWKRGTLVIQPHFYLATGEGTLVYDGGRRPYRTKGRVLGYRLTD